MKTLIIVDPQNDFMPGGSLAVPGGDKIIPVINKLQENFDLVIASQDWHRSGQPTECTSSAHHPTPDRCRLPGFQ